MFWHGIHDDVAEREDTITSVATSELDPYRHVLLPLRQNET